MREEKKKMLVLSHLYIMQLVSLAEHKDWEQLT